MLHRGLVILSRICIAGGMSNPAPHGASVRLGIFGGTFDPVHTGHLIVARDVLERARLDHVVFVPAAQNPLKGAGPIAPGEWRAAMIRAALRDIPRFSVSTVDLDRPPPSYGIDTVQALRREWPGARLHWILGWDQLPSLHRWHRVDALVREVEFLVLRRPGVDAEAPDIPGLRLRGVDTRLVELSSTEIRRRIAARKPVDFFLPSRVINLIQEHHLYPTS